MSDARQMIGLLDLTNLNDDCSADDIARLSARGKAAGVAALCVWPRFVKQAKADGLRVATVANFPGGGLSHEAVAAEIAGALKDGADEIDLVMPYKALMAGRAAEAAGMLDLAREIIPAGRLYKVILETGELKSPELIRAASALALAAGADFLKTSTGKVKVNATPEAARLMLEAIRESGRNAGFKAAGGVKTAADAAGYVMLAESIMGAGWATAERFRFGASGLLDALEGLTKDNTGY